ncbi:MAG: outer membrane protein transport protein [Ignavibacteriae bacterium]|nr:outer membrane protein transport protein [Ignavibacteriota bacterium]
MKRFLFVFTLIAIALSSSFATNGTRMIGFDAKTVGRGGSSIGFFDNTSLLFSNPAGISFIQGTQLDAAFSLMVPGIKFANGLNQSQGKTNYFPLFDAGYVNNTFGNFAWGIGAYTQGGMGADFKLNHQLFRDQSGAFVQQEYHSKLAVMQGGVSAAYKLRPDLSIGASAHIVYSMLEFSMPYSLSPSIMKGVVNPTNGMTFGDMFAAPQQAGGFGYSEVTAAAAMKELKAWGFSGKAGLAWKPNENVTFGISYTSPTSLTYKNGKAHMDMTYQLNNAFGLAMMGVMAQNPNMTQAQAQQAVIGMFTSLGIDMSKDVIADYDLEVKMKFPQSVGFGGMFNLSDGFRLGFDFEWINWKNAFDKMSISMKNGANVNINRMMGSSGSLNVDFPMNWEDAYTTRIGFEVDPSSVLTLRVGGAFGTNPVPNETVFPVFPAIVENHFTAGLTYKLSPTFAIHGAFEHAFNNWQTSLSPNLVAQEYSGSTSQLNENIYHISLSWMP